METGEQKGSRRLWYAVLFLVILFFVGLAPVLSALTAGAIANWAGCTLHEGFKNPCLIGGADYGDLLYNMAVIGWLSLVTLPLSAFSLFFLVLVLATIAFRRIKSKRSTSAPTQQ